MVPWGSRYSVACDSMGRSEIYHTPNDTITYINSKQKLILRQAQKRFGTSEQAATASSQSIDNNVPIQHNQGTLVANVYFIKQIYY